MADGLTDEQLISDYQASSDSVRRTDCANELFRRHQTRVALWCLRITGDREQAADLAQEVFIKAFKNLGSFRSDSKFSTWLYAIARHHCCNFVRSQSRVAERADDGLLRDLADTSAGPDSRLEEERVRQLVARLLDEALDELERKIFVLNFGEGLPLDSIKRLLTWWRATRSLSPFSSGAATLRRRR